MKFRFLKYKSKHEGQVDVSVNPDDEVYENGIIVYFDNVGVLLNSIQASAFAHAILAAREQCS